MPVAYEYSQQLQSFHCYKNLFISTGTYSTRQLSKKLHYQNIYLLKN